MAGSIDQTISIVVSTVTNPCVQQVWILLFATHQNDSEIILKEFPVTSRM